MPGRMYNNGESYGGYFSDVNASELSVTSGLTATTKSLLRSNGVVYVRGRFVGSFSANSVVCTLPEDYRPDVEIVGIPAASRGSSGTHFMTVKVSTNGNVSIEGSVTSGDNEVDLNFSIII